jgi:CRP-like cAMP-binding protein
MVSIPLHGAKTADRRLRRLYLELKKAGIFVARRRGAVLCRQAGRPRGAFLLSTGQARLWMESRHGDPVAFHAISAPCILALPATMAGHPYNFHAALTSDAQVARLDRKAILRVLEKHPGLAMCVVEVLGRGVVDMMKHPVRAVRKSA